MGPVKGLLFVFALLLALFCGIGTAWKNCPDPGKPIMFKVIGGNPLTECEAPGQGYDPVTERCLRQIIDISFVKQCSVDIKQSDTTVLIPDQTGVATGLTGLLAYNEIYIYNSTSSYEKNYVSKTDLSVSIGGSGMQLSLAFNSTKTRVSRTLAEGKNNFAQTYLEIPALSITLDTPSLLPLDPSFESELLSLPTTYDKSRYHDFIKTWGAFYLSKTFYGGFYNQTAVFHSSLFQSYSYESVTNSISATFEITAANYSIPISYNSVKGWNKTSDYQSFESQSISPFTIQGGKGVVFASDGFNAWLPTLYDAWTVLVFSSSVEPIYLLAKDPTISANLKQAILEYGNGV